MKRISIIILTLILLLCPVSAKSFLKPGTSDTASVANGQTTSAFFDFTPKLYNYHIFGFTNMINENPHMSFSSLVDITLIPYVPKNPVEADMPEKADPLIYANEDNTLYFSYSYSGQESYEVTVKGADLKQIGDTTSKPYFKTKTIARFPDNYPYVPGSNISESTGNSYNAMVVLPNTSSAEVQKYFGNYGSIELSIVATYVDSDGAPSTAQQPEAVGHAGDFFLECKSF